MTLIEWLAGDDVGESSKFMASVLSGEFKAHNSYPYDPDDFGRCWRFLTKFPALAAKLPEMRKQGAVWSRLIDNWDEIKRLYIEEVPSGICPKCYALMQQLRGGTR